MSRTWILLRGLARETRHWGPFLERFEASFPQDQVVGLDLPAVRSLPEMASLLSQEAAARSMGTPVHLFAISLGAMVALEWARQQPASVAKMILANTSVRGLSVFHKRLRLQIWTDFLKAAGSAQPRVREKRILELISNHRENREAILPLWTKIAQESPVTLKTVIQQLWAASAYEYQPPPPSVPTLLLVGLGDRLVDPSCTEALHQATQWPIERHPWAGHDLAIDDPEWLLQKIHKFCDVEKQQG